MQQQKLNDIDRDLLVAQLVYQEAVIRHRAERSQLTHRMVQEAQAGLTEARRAALLASWAKSAEHPVTCPRCKVASSAHEWVANADEEVPPWAEVYAEAGVSAARRYSCHGCGFHLTYVAGAAA